MATKLIPQTKVCTKCAEAKPADREHFPPVGKGLRPQCRPCWREHERAYFWANREAKRESKRRQWKKTDKGSARTKLRAWKAENPDKVQAINNRRADKIKTEPALRAAATERTRKWRETNRDQIRERRLQSYHAEPDRARGHCRRWREGNAEKVAAYGRAYREAHPEQVSAYSERRRARLLHAEGEFSGHDVIALIRRVGRVCYYCGSAIKRFQVDHFIPLSRGGSNWPENLVISCGPCNRSKGAKLPWEWKPERFLEGSTPR